MSNKTAFVTGGSSGIGGSVVEALEARGWTIIQPSHDELDLGDLDAADAFAKKVRHETAKIDAFIHVAGIWHKKDKVLADIPLGSFTTNQIVETINVGLTSVIVMLNNLLPIMSGATVVGISGTFADGAKGWLPYFVSKRALEDFLVGLSQDNAELKVFGISPADTATKAFDTFYHEYFADAQPPDAVSALVVKLVEGQSDYKSGDVIELRDGKDTPGYHV